MAAARMHADEVDTDAALVRRLLAAQFPRWAELPIERVESSGTDNAIYRLGDELAARLPRRPGARAQVHKEFEWLPKLAPLLPLAVPVPVAKGEPGEGYPWHWSVCRWLEGENPTPGRLADPSEAAVALARFVAALQRIDATGGPPPGPHNVFRGVALAARDGYTRKALAQLHGVVDTDAATEAWDAALRAPAWQGPPAWIHGDLTSANLLAARGELTGVIDFGCLGVGDPACDLIVAWNLLAGETRSRFRAELGVDEATWARGRGWALSVSLIEIPYYRTTNPALVARATRMIAEVLGRV
jgi:aminoglycoside phosphotransferase (APT) family kinase protein